MDFVWRFIARALPKENLEAHEVRVHAQVAPLLSRCHNPNLFRGRNGESMGYFVVRRLVRFLRGLYGDTR